MSDSICKNFKIQAIIPEFKRKWKGNDVATSLNQRHKWKWQRIGISNLNLFFKKSTTIYYACFNNYFQMLTLAQQTIDLCLVDPFNMHLNDCLKQRTSFSRYGYKPKLINWLNPIFFFVISSHLKQNRPLIFVIYIFFTIKMMKAWFK